MADGDTPTNETWNSPNNQSAQTHTGVFTWRLEAGILKETKTNNPKTEDLISGSANQTQTLLHYTVYVLSNTRTEILNFFGNWIIIFIIHYCIEFLVLSAFCCKKFKFLGFLWISCYQYFTILGIFTNILLSWNNLERMWNLWWSQENSWDLAALA